MEDLMDGDNRVDTAGEQVRDTGLGGLVLLVALLGLVGVAFALWAMVAV